MTERAKLYPANPHKEGTITTNATARTQNPYINYVENNTFRSGVQIVWWTNTTVNAQNGVITINNTAWWWDSIWSTWNYSTIGEFITPKDAKTVYFGIKWETTIYYWTLLGDASLKFQRYWLQASTSPVEFNPMWAKFWVNANQARNLNVGWVSIAWELVVWGNSDNSHYIRMYASWSRTSSEKHYEIMANKDLAVWTYGWAFLFFSNNGTDSWPYRIWVNNQSPKATLDVKWTLRINTTSNNDCSSPTCDSNTVWSIMYRSNAFYWCIRSWSNSQWQPNYWWYKFSMSNTETETEMNRTINCSNMHTCSRPTQLSL